jgi:vacuolar-type H+-ATPase subunit C/Vma6
MRVLLLAGLVLLAAPLAGAQVADSWTMPPEVMQYAVTDGTPLDLDNASTLAAVQDVEARISGASIHDCVYNLTIAEGPSYRLMGSPTQDEFVQKHKDVFARLGLPSALHNFT